MSQMFSLSDASGALALLRALKDPGSEAVLQDIIARETALAELRKQTDARADAINAQAADLTARETALAQAQTQLEQQRGIALSSIATRTAEVSRHEEEFAAAMTATTAQITKDRAAVKDREDAVALREAPLKTREADVAAREAAIGARENAADMRAQEAASTIESFRALLPPAPGE